MGTIDEYFGNFSKIDKIVFKTCILIFIILLFSGCMATKKTHDAETTTTTATTNDVKETEKTTATISEPIKDNIVINVPESDNAEVMKMFNEVMRQMNSSKTSGSNSYNSRYDEANKKWIIDFMVAQSKIQEVATTNDTATTSDISFDKQVNDYIKKIVVPWWAYGIVLFLLRKEIFWLMKMLFPPLRTMSLFAPTKNS
jgi:hypothetical protein